MPGDGGPQGGGGPGIRPGAVGQALTWGRRGRIPWGQAQGMQTLALPQPFWSRLLQGGEGRLKWCKDLGTAISGPNAAKAPDTVLALNFAYQFSRFPSAEKLIQAY